VKPGGYYGPTALRELRGPCRECFPSEQARDPELAERLWDVSVTMTGIDPGLPPVNEKGAAKEQRSATTSQAS
jgi:hypothetical protein